MTHLDEIKSFIHVVDRDKKIDRILPVITTLISGLVMKAIGVMRFIPS